MQTIQRYRYVSMHFCTADIACNDCQWIYTKHFWSKKSVVLINNNNLGRVYNEDQSSSLKQTTFQLDLKLFEEFSSI